MASLQCARCGASLPILMASVQTSRCGYCGAVHHDDGTPISPPMTPAYDEHGRIAARLSPWMLPGTRPVVSGRYDVRFYDAPGLVLQWDSESRHFYDARGRQVFDATLQTWRGGWA